MKDYGEPWSDLIAATPRRLDSEARYIVSFASRDEWVRAVACVNALRGIEDPAAFIKAADEMFAAMNRLRYAHDLPPNDETIESALSHSDGVVDAYLAARGKP